MSERALVLFLCPSPRNHMMLHTLYQNWLGLYRSRHHHRSTLLDTIRNNHGPERNHLGMAKVLCILLPALASPRQICSRKTELFCKHLHKMLALHTSRLQQLPIRRGNLLPSCAHTSHLLQQSWWHVSRAAHQQVFTASTFNASLICTRLFA